MKSLSEFLGESKEQLNESTGGVILYRPVGDSNYSFYAVVTSVNTKNIKSAIEGTNYGVIDKTKIDEICEALSKGKIYKQNGGGVFNLTSVKFY